MGIKEDIVNDLTALLSAADKNTKKGIGAGWGVPGRGRSAKARPYGGPATNLSAC